MGTRRRVFPEAFKREAVDRLTSSVLSASKVAQELGLHETVLRRWVSDLAPQATGPARRPILQAASPSPADLAAENARLRRENERLRMERDILKRMARPVRKGVVKDGKMVCINVSGLKAEALAKMDIRAA